MEKADVLKRKVKSPKLTLHFGSLMELCHEKHSELPPEKRGYKGRVVFRGDQVRDDTGHFAVFTEQSTSASHLESAKVLDAIARFPGNDGEDADARGAYHQVILEEEPEYKDTETCIPFPRNRRPKSWDKFTESVYLLKRNLYGHPLAGLF